MLAAVEDAAKPEFLEAGLADVKHRDSARFIGEYTAKGVFKMDPFISLDIEGVGELVRIGTERGRQVKPGLKCGICGEHGGDRTN